MCVYASVCSGGPALHFAPSHPSHAHSVSRQVLSPTYKQRNEDFRKLFKQLPDSERLIVGEGIEGHAVE